MLFNSLDFAIFLPLVFIFYWTLNRRRKAQNLLILFSSYLFYGWWNWKFLSLILISTLVDYIIGNYLVATDKKIERKLLLSLSIIINLGMLGFFKYYNFFLENFVEAFSFLGRPLSVDRLHIVLPVGISFYTFQTLSYTIDVYRKRLIPTRDFISFASFVSFFPQLVAGPIERATNLLPQFLQNRKFNYRQAIDGLRQILWGFFKKVVIADQCAGIVNQIFEHPGAQSGSTLALGAILFAFQIYGDFSGYSDIAIGTSRLFGLNLMQNFAFPYFSRDIAEFWRRWHISLSTWFRDYLYIPLGGSRGTLFQQIWNTLIIFLVSGFWHGANWTFIAWGLLNAIYFIPLMISGNNRKYMEIVGKGGRAISIGDIFKVFLTFGLTLIGWIFFRSSSLNDAFLYLSGFLSWTLFSIPKFISWSLTLFITIFLVIEWFGRDGKYALEILMSQRPKVVRYASYYALTLAILYFSGGEQEFIYFQF